MLTLAGFLMPYLIAFVTFLRLVGCAVFPLIVPFVACLHIVLSPWLIPADLPMLRFLASISAAMLAFKVVDVSLDLKRQRSVTWQEYAGFLFNPFTLVRRSLRYERRPSQRENLVGLLRGALGCAGAIVFGLSALFHEWIFFAAVGRLQGYQLAFFALQGIAAASTARVKVRGKLLVPWVVGTLIFNLLTSVLFFASIHSVSPFYSRGLPWCLQSW